MKKIMTLTALFVICFIMSSCGKDGEDGDVYCSVYLGYGIYGYYDNNPGIPSYFSNGKYYKCSAGSYSYGYEDDYKYYWGTYTLEQNKGEEGGIFTDGDDGSDTYFTNYCYSTKSGGPSIVAYPDASEEKNRTEKNTDENKLSKVPGSGKVNFDPDSETIVKGTTTSGSYTIEYECWIYDKK